MNATGVLLIAGAVYGPTAARFGVIPRWASRVFISLPLVAYLSSDNVVNYFPNAWTVPLSLAWATVGIWLIRSTNRHTQGWPSRISVDSRAMTLRSALKAYRITAITVVLAVFLIGLGLLLEFDEDSEGVFGAAYGTAAVHSGVALLVGLVSMSAGRINAEQGNRLIAGSLGIGILGYFWTVIPVLLGCSILWFGIRQRGLVKELSPAEPPQCHVPGNKNS